MNTSRLIVYYCLFIVCLLSGCISDQQPTAGVDAAYQELFWFEDNFVEDHLHEKLEPNEEGETFMNLMATKKWAAIEAINQAVQTRPNVDRQAILKDLMKKYGTTGSFVAFPSRPSVLDWKYDISVSAASNFDVERGSKYYRFLAQRTSGAKKSE